MLQEGEPIPGPKSGLLSNTQKWIVWGDTCADKERDFIGKGCVVREQQGKGTQENCSATRLTVSGFMVMGLVSGLSLANHLAWTISGDSGSFLVAHASLSQDGFQREGFWGVRAGHIVSSLLSAPLEFSRFVFGGRTMFLIGTPVVRQLKQPGLAKADGFSQQFPNINILCYQGVFVKTKESTLIYVLAVAKHQTLIRFHQCPFSVPGSHPGYYTAFHPPVSLVCSGLWQLTSFPLFLWPWQSWGTLVRYFAECPLIWTYLMFSSWLDWSYGFWGKNSPEMKCPSHHTLSWIACYPHVLLLVMLTAITWWYLPGLSTVKWLHPLPLPNPHPYLSIL